jgi:outer membrane protein assembly factor BamE
MHLSRTALVLVVSLLAGCSSWSFPLSPYKIDVQQGNHVTQEMVDKLKPGLTKSQVRFILGTPLITDMFHVDRWDYFYSYQKNGKVTEQRRITVFFEKEVLKKIEGDVTPVAEKSN